MQIHLETINECYKKPAQEKIFDHLFEQIFRRKTIKYDPGTSHSKLPEPSNAFHNLLLSTTIHPTTFNPFNPSQRTKRYKMMPLHPTEQEMQTRTETTANSPLHKVGDAKYSSSCCRIPSPTSYTLYPTTKENFSPRKSCLASKNPKKKNKERISIESTASPHVLFRQPTRWEASDSADSMPILPSRQTLPQEPSSSDLENLDEDIASFVSSIQVEQRMNITRKRNSLVPQAA